MKNINENDHILFKWSYILIISLQHAKSNTKLPTDQNQVHGPGVGDPYSIHVQSSDRLTNDTAAHIFILI